MPSKKKTNNACCNTTTTNLLNSHREGTGGGVLVTVGVYVPSPMAVVTLDLQGYFGNTELSLELWTIISGISGFDD
jgi:hypothetical protein